jgi:hypothetical protein
VPLDPVGIREGLEKEGYLNLLKSLLVGKNRIPCFVSNTKILKMAGCDHGLSYAPLTIDIQ